MTLALVLVLTILSYDQQRALGPLDPTGLVAAHRGAGVAGAPYTGTSLNPSRSVGSAVLAPHGDHFWMCVVGLSRAGRR